MRRLALLETKKRLLEALQRLDDTQKAKEEEHRETAPVLTRNEERLLRGSEAFGKISVARRQVCPPPPPWGSPWPLSAPPLPQRFASQLSISCGGGRGGGGA